MLLDQIKATKRGAAILAEWLGEGGQPVPPLLATHRAHVCAECPKNEPGNWWSNLKSVLASTIREYLSVKRSLNISTPDDPRLGTCSVCKCNNPLQVWVPIQHVKKHTPEAMIEKFPTECWKRKELTA